MKTKQIQNKKVKYCSWDDLKNDKKEQKVYNENLCFISDMYKKYARK